MNDNSVRSLFPKFADTTEIYRSGEDFFLFLHPKMKDYRLDFMQPDYYSFIVVRNGQINALIDGTQYQVPTNSSLAILPRQHVVTEVLDENINSIVWLLSSEFASKLLVQNEYTVYSNLNRNPVRHYSPEEMRIVEDIAILQRDALLHPKANSLIDFNAMLLSFGFRMLFWGRVEEANMVNVESARHEMMMMRFTQLLDRHYLREHRVAWYAGELCVAPKYLSECAKRATGHTAGWWIDHYLMRDTIRLLRQKRLSIKTISVRLGFEDPSAFGKWFKRLKGQSPAHFRQNECKR